MQTEPQPVKAITFDPALSTLTSLLLSWVPLVTEDEVGGSPILNYKVRFNQGTFTNSWVDVAEVLTTSYDLTGLIAGTDYQIVVLA